METRHGSKRRKIENETRVNLDEDVVPHDLVIEILRRLPAKSLARFLLVSKLWATIIRSRDFIRSFPLKSSVLEPRLLFAFKDSDDQNSRQIWNFFSSSSGSSDSGPVSYLSLTTCSSFLRQDRYYENYEDRYYEVPHYVNGLISIGCGVEQIICNPSTGKSITLPKVKSRRKLIHRFFGYDPVDGHYKVLCMSEKLNRRSDDPSSEHQVFTLGGVDRSWRMIECNIPHRPRTNGVCINGVVYYTAVSGTRMNELCLARFDVRSEKFGQVVRFLGDHTPPSSIILFRHGDQYLTSYKGKVTLAVNARYMSLDMWILEDAEKHEWSKVCISIRHLCKNLKLDYPLRVTAGDISHNNTDEIVFVLCKRKRLVLIYYDHKKKTAVRRFVRNLDKSHKDFRRLSDMVPISNYVESVMLL